MISIIIFCYGTIRSAEVFSGSDTRPYDRADGCTGTSHGAEANRRNPLDEARRAPILLMATKSVPFAMPEGTEKRESIVRPSRVRPGEDDRVVSRPLRGERNGADYTGCRQILHSPV